MSTHRQRVLQANAYKAIRTAADLANWDAVPSWNGRIFHFERVSIRPDNGAAVEIRVTVGLREDGTIDASYVQVKDPSSEVEVQQASLPRNRRAVVRFLAGRK